MLVNVVMQRFYCFTFLVFFSFGLLFYIVPTCQCTCLESLLVSRTAKWVTKFRVWAHSVVSQPKCLFLFAVNHPKLTCIGAFAIKTLSECVCVIFLRSLLTI